VKAEDRKKRVRGNCFVKSEEKSEAQENAGVR
jgi:hypothetical protein